MNENTDKTSNTDVQETKSAHKAVINGGVWLSGSETPSDGDDERNVNDSAARKPKHIHIHINKG